MTGDVNITTLHVESAIQQCATFITLNDTLQTTNPDVAKKLKSFCPRNCSNHGYCIEGNVPHVKLFWNIKKQTFFLSNTSG